MYSDRLEFTPIIITWVTFTSFYPDMLASIKMKKWGLARAAIAKLDGITNTLTDPQIMVNTISLQEAKESSKIENIVTTTDALYEAMALSADENKSDATK